MIKIYGIPNCGSVKKALDFIKSTKEEFEFIDFKKINRPIPVEIKKLVKDREFFRKNKEWEKSL